ncbi:MAG: hypothetical protein ACREXU_04560, partial [Gammaproteobacteria bacterium]
AVGNPHRVMRVLLVGGDIGTRAAVERLIKDTGHHLEWRRTASLGGLEVENCDLLLVDGASLLRDEAQRLRTCLMSEARSGGSAVFFFNTGIEAGGKLSGAACPPCRVDCGVHRTAAGHWSLRCRLQEQALEEYRAGVLDAGSRPAGRAVVFEYQGEADE